jgi:hypothetical protein
MTASIRILNKGFVAEYFRQNVFFILIVLLVAFGFLSGAEHKQLVISAAKSKVFLFYIFGAWIVYFFFNILFAFRTLAKKEFQIYFNINQLTGLKPVMIWVYAYFMCSPLSIYYGFHMIFRGLYEGYIFMPIAVIVFHVIFTLLGGLVLYFRTLKTQESSLNINFQFNAFSFLKKPFPLFFVAELFKTRPMMLLLVKFLAFLLISFFVYLFPTDDYDHRLFSIALVMIAFANYPLIQEWLIFENQKSNFIKALPISTPKNIFYMLATILILVVPEILVFAFKTPSFVNLSYVFSWAISLIIFILGIKTLFYVPIKSEQMQQNLFWLFIVFLILVMYKVQLIVLSLPLLLFSVWSIFKFFGNWEPGRELFYRE